MKEYYLILEQKKKYQYGAFPRTKSGKAKANKYLKKLRKEENHLKFIIK